jgi:hypothetical protein
MSTPAPPDEFHAHELMDRASMVSAILELLREHPAHTAATREAYEAAALAVGNLYQVAAAARFADSEDKKP